MQADAVALTIFANNRLQGHFCPEFWPKASVFRWINKVNFEARVGRFLASEDPAEWVDALRDQGVIGFHVHAGGGNPIGEAFVGGSSVWLVEAIREDRIEHWTRVSTIQRESRFVRTALAGPICPAKPRGLDRLADELRSVFERVQSLVERGALRGPPEQLSWFAKQFGAAQAALASDAPETSFTYSELGCVTCVPLPAKRVLAACQSAWLFGGAGTWNEAFPAPEAQEEYWQVTIDMHALLIYAICEAANASFPAR